MSDDTPTFDKLRDLIAKHSDKIGRQYILDGHTPVPCDDLMVWATWYSSADRTVSRDDINGFLVSTVFLGLDHNWWGGKPALFETMIFHDGKTLDYQTRCSTWAEAEAMHQRAIMYVRNTWDTPRTRAR